MKRSERKLWRSARTVQDLADLTARWLEGDIGSQPGYAPRYGPDRETAELIGTLAACNRAGYLTTGSQPGLIDEYTQQRAAVEGFTADMRLLRRLEALAKATGLLTVVHLASVPGTSVDGFTVTIDQGEPFTWFGRHLDSDLLTWLWRDCDPAAVNAVLASYQVTLVDPECGRNDLLWSVLEEAIGMTSPICADCGCTERTPCPGGCGWMPSSFFDLCTACYESEPESGPVYLDGGDVDDTDDGDGVENECENCGAPYYHSGCDGPFCTWDCAEVGAEAAAYVPPVDLVKRQLQTQSWGWAVGAEPPF